MKPKATYVSDPNYVKAWQYAIRDYLGPLNGNPLPGRHLLRQFGMPNCKKCWDTGFCNECLGLTPQWCPGQCNDGYCGCAAGRARRIVIDSHKPKVQP